MILFNSILLSTHLAQSESVFPNVNKSCLFLLAVNNNFTVNMVIKNNRN